jgi:hypothetical protein
MRWTRPYTATRKDSLVLRAGSGQEIEARFQGIAEAKLPSAWVRVAVGRQ